MLVAIRYLRLRAFAIYLESHQVMQSVVEMATITSVRRSKEKKNSMTYVRVSVCACVCV